MIFSRNLKYVIDTRTFWMVVAAIIGYQRLVVGVRLKTVDRESQLARRRLAPIQPKQQSPLILSQRHNRLFTSLGARNTRPLV